MPRPATPDERDDRRTKVATLLLAHATQGQIGTMLGVSRQTVNADVKAIRQQWREERAEAYDRYVAEDVKRLEALERAIWPQAMGGKLLAVDRVLAIISQRSQLIGTEAPIKARVEVVTEDVIDAEIRRLEAELEDRGVPGEASAAR